MDAAAIGRELGQLIEDFRQRHPGVSVVMVALQDADALAFASLAPPAHLVNAAWAMLTKAAHGAGGDPDSAELHAATAAVEALQEFIFGPPPRLENLPLVN